MPYRVRHFNRSLRCCKLLHTALHTLLLEAFFDQTATSSSTMDCISHLKPTVDAVPSEFVNDERSQEWFKILLDNLERNSFAMNLNNWATESSRTNSTFCLWYFVLRQLLEPLIQLYIFIRTCNFAARNNALYRFSPIFFATNHRNYSRLCAQHLFDLQSSSDYLIARFSRSFAVTRSTRSFSTELCINSF